VLFVADHSTIDRVRFKADSARERPSGEPGRQGEDGRVSRVLFYAAIYLGTTTRVGSRPPRHLSGCSYLGPWRATCKRPDRRLLRGGLPFSPRCWRCHQIGTGLCCSHASEINLASVPIWTVSAHRSALPRVSPGTLALCSSDFPLTRTGQRPRCPSSPNRDQHLLIPGRWCRRGDSNSHGRKPTTP
jgi:hypothetical protein